MNGFAALGGGGGAPGAPVAPLPRPPLATVGSFVVSFFGARPVGGGVGLSGTFIRTVSLLTAGCSLLGGNVIRIVSPFGTSSEGDSEEAGGFSSAITRM